MQRRQWTSGVLIGPIHAPMLLLHVLLLHVPLLHVLPVQPTAREVQCSASFFEGVSRSARSTCTCSTPTTGTGTGTGATRSAHCESRGYRTRMAAGNAPSGNGAVCQVARGAMCSTMGCVEWACTKMGLATGRRGSDGRRSGSRGIHSHSIAPHTRVADRLRCRLCCWLRWRSSCCCCRRLRSSLRSSMVRCPRRCPHGGCTCEGSRWPAHATFSGRAADSCHSIECSPAQPSGKHSVG